MHTDEEEFKEFSLPDDLNAAWKTLVQEGMDLFVWCVCVFLCVYL